MEMHEKYRKLQKVEPAGVQSRIVSAIPIFRIALRIAPLNTRLSDSKMLLKLQCQSCTQILPSPIFMPSEWPIFCELCGILLDFLVNVKGPKSVAKQRDLKLLMTFK